MIVEDELMRWQQGRQTFDRWSDGYVHAVKGEYIDVYCEGLCGSTGAVRFTWAPDHQEYVTCPVCLAILGGDSVAFSRSTQQMQQNPSCKRYANGVRLTTCSTM